MPMHDMLLKNRNGFDWGYTAITSCQDKQGNSGINFGILKLRAGESWSVDAGFETAVLLLDGKVGFHFQSRCASAERNSLFDQTPTALHVPSGCPAMVVALSDVECAVQSVENKNWFDPMVFDQSNMLEKEHRGQGLLDDTAYRIVRTVFDGRNRPQANLVLGEVITFPGRWSSYPPHHHDQPELYHYRFTEPHGYGHGECGDDVLKIKQFDTLKILDNNDHSQCAAPGYGMYYLWIIRHLHNNPYTSPTFTEQHDWTRHQDANERVWMMEPME